jgi:glycosyltransferase involved in cell wall biosynthesis
VRRLLVFAYYFPPMGMSGVQRIVRLLRHLPENGWQPVVVTASPRRYAAWDDALFGQVEAAGIQVERTASLDPLHLPTPGGRRRTHAIPEAGADGRAGWVSLLGRLLVPDSKVGWLPFALSRAFELHRRHPFDAVLSTGPPHSSHVGAAWFSARAGVPLALDFRDDWVENPRQTFPTRLHERLHRQLERYAVGQASEVWTVSEQTGRDLKRRHPGAVQVTLPHGFDESAYPRAYRRDTGGAMEVLYAGVFYHAQRPDTFLRALALARQQRPDARMIAVFAGLVPDSFTNLVDELGLSDCVRYDGYLASDAAAARMAQADVLWMTVGHQKGGHQIVPGKVYAYFGARRPILGLVPPGACRDELERYGAARIADPDDAEAAARHLLDLYDLWTRDQLPQPDAPFVDQFEGSAVARRAARRVDLLAGFG